MKAAMEGVMRYFQRLRTRLRLYWPLTKSLQTSLLLSTGLAGYMSARCPVLHWDTLLFLAVSLFLAIAGSTILNMWYDRDIDAVMNRTHHRPLADGRVAP
ncbi:MAG: UbiA family prenyltransferase, partial [Anaerolineales bacterium]